MINIDGYEFPPFDLARLLRTVFRVEPRESFGVFTDLPDPRAVEHRRHDVLPPDAGQAHKRSAAPPGMVERLEDQAGRGVNIHDAGRPPGRNHVTTRPPTTGMLGRRAQAQRRLRRAAGRRLFCTTNGCTTYLVPDGDGRRATCPICGLRRSLPAGFITIGPDTAHTVALSGAN